MDGEETLRLSWSQLRTHEECHQKRALQVAGHRSPASDIRGYFRGTVVDLCMREWLDSDDPKPGAMAAMVDARLEKAESDARDSGDGIVRWRGPGDKAAVARWCKELLIRLEPILFRHVIPLEYQPALRFSAPLVIPYLDGTPTKIELIGEMDILTRGEQPTSGTALTARDDMNQAALPPFGFCVWDLKGTEDGQYWRKVTGQLVFYEIATFLLWKSWPVQSGLIQPMCKEPVLAFRFTKSDRDDLLFRITKVATDIWRRDVTPNLRNCHYCNVRHACPAHAVPGGRGRTTGLV